MLAQTFQQTKFDNFAHKLLYRDALLYKHAYEVCLESNVSQKLFIKNIAIHLQNMTLANTHKCS